MRTHLTPGVLVMPCHLAPGRSVELCRGKRMARLDPSVFGLPVARLREGYYSDAYLNHARVLLAAEDRHPRVLMQVF